MSLIDLLQTAIYLWYCSLLCMIFIFMGVLSLITDIITYENECKYSPLLVNVIIDDIHTPSLILLKLLLIFLVMILVLIYKCVMVCKKNYTEFVKENV